MLNLCRWIYVPIDCDYRIDVARYPDEDVRVTIGPSANLSDPIVIDSLGEVPTRFT